MSPSPSPTPIARGSVFALGLISYAVGVSALVGFILTTLGLLPFMGLPFEGLSTLTAIALNLALLFGFAFQHSVMARAKFKAWWTQFVPAAAERSIFVLATGLVLWPLLLMWQPMSTQIWEVSSPGLRYGIYGLALAGYGYLFVASFAINHFELFGLQQVTRYWQGRPITRPPFKERWMYRFDRHPIMTGVIVGMWATPSMSLDHLLLSIGFTAYVWIGVYFEERALRREWGAGYDDYCRRVGSIVPSFSGGQRQRRPRLVQT